MAAQQLSYSPTAAGVPLPVPEEDIDLNTRISVVEQQLIAREQRLRGQVQGLRQRASDAVAPRALLLKVAGVALAGAGLVWALRRGGRSAGPSVGEPESERERAPATYADGPRRRRLEARVRTRAAPRAGCGGGVGASGSRGR